MIECELYQIPGRPETENTRAQVILNGPNTVPPRRGNVQRKRKKFRESGAIVLAQHVPVDAPGGSALERHENLTYMNLRFSISMGRIEHSPLGPNPPVYALRFFLIGY